MVCRRALPSFRIKKKGAYETFFADRWKVVKTVINKKEAMTKGNESSTEEHRAIVNKIFVHSKN